MLKNKRRNKNEKKSVKKIEVEVLVTIINGVTNITYNGYQALSECLRVIYKNHGNFYKQELGISYEDSFQAGWNPDGVSFMKDDGGWGKMVSSEGRIHKEIIKKIVSPKHAIFDIQEILKEK